ncbi:hypothetical protein M436DRAFT_86008 [Aureobasidium namibiae CBS 147.97]|uniref:Uncharacterized protein n=1 Tax=Aureobasidium namibiae CBS 147.97 TaxID=1043004 RepID=A0A074WG45_9PEZI
MNPTTKSCSEVRNINLRDNIDFQEMTEFHDSLTSSTSVDYQSGHNYHNNMDWHHELAYQAIAQWSTLTIDEKMAATNARNKAFADAHKAKPQSDSTPEPGPVGESDRETFKMVDEKPSPPSPGSVHENPLSSMNVTHSHTSTGSSEDDNEVAVTNQQTSSHEDDMLPDSALARELRFHFDWLPE